MNKEVAIELRRRLQIKGALRLDDITKPLGISVKEVESDGFDGALVRRSSGVGGRILVKRGIRELTRKRFTAVHEIGHYLLHKDSDRVSCGTLAVSYTHLIAANSTASMATACSTTPSSWLSLSLFIDFSVSAACVHLVPVAAALTG